MDAGEPGDLVASSPPSLVRALVTDFDCRDAGRPLTSLPERMDETGLEEWLGLMGSPERRLPPVAVWGPERSGWADRVAYAACGTARVTSFDRPAARQLRALGLPWSRPAVVAIPPDVAELESAVAMPSAPDGTPQQFENRVAASLTQISRPQPPPEVVGLRARLFGALERRAA